MQNPKVNQYAKQLALLVPDTAKRRAVLPVIVGMAIASFLPVPQSPDISAMTVFGDMHAAKVSSVTSYLNEQVFLDVPCALECAKAMFLVRFKIVNGKVCTYTVNPEFDIFSIALGLSTVLPVGCYEALKEVGMSASSVLNLTHMLLEDLKADGQISL